MTAIFRQIGPYTIERPIGQGGMASVFLARDTRSNAVVALKVVHPGDEHDHEAREILEAEQRGAELQLRFGGVSGYVPKVYESGFASDYFYIAMEYIAGEDLSQAIHRGPMPWARAVAITIQLCEFLEEAYRFEADAGSRRVLLHNDLKPRNIRLVDEERIKVLDFGAAKALSLSRKVTRNDFGSTAYLSPECLETGDRDLHSDAWALGVLLYEMVRGHQPFRAGDTRRLEQLIRARRAPEPLGPACPLALEAVIAKLLAPYPQDRYGSPADIRADLLRVQAGQDTQALLDGWPGRSASFGEADEPVTRRTRSDVPTRQFDDEPQTRRTVPPAPEPAAAAAMPVSVPGPAPTPATVPAPRRRRRVGRLIVTVLVLMLAGAAMNEGCVSSRADALAATVPLKDFQGLNEVWPEYRKLEDRSSFGGVGVGRLRTALANQTLVLAERVMGNYRTPMPTVREGQWRAAADALRRAIVIAPGNRDMRAALQLCQGHLQRINGEADKSRGRAAEAQQQFTEAVVAFREAAAIKPGWPDPFLGLARTFIYGLDDVDRGADALAQAEKNGHQLSEREITQLGDGYRLRGEALARTAQTLHGMEQEKDYLTRASQAFKDALERYQRAAGFGNVAATIRDTQKKRDAVEARLAELSKWRWPWG